ncbi:MAG: hypothetical protein IPF55_19540 [Rhodoferax sp.]|nr:hypothetical protein [Rhodoferax sp.]
MTTHLDKPELTASKPVVTPTDQLVSTQHKVRINGETIHYTVTCGTVVLKKTARPMANARPTSRAPPCSSLPIRAMASRTPVNGP